MSILFCVGILSVAPACKDDSITTAENADTALMVYEPDSGWVSGNNVNSRQSASDDASTEGSAGEDGSTTSPEAQDGVSTQETPDGEVGPQPGEFGHPCTGNEDCYTGYCIDSPEGNICTKTCADESSCPEGWSCTQIGADVDQAYICIPNDIYTCRPCDTDDDCNMPGSAPTGICWDTGNEGAFCTRLCADKPCAAPLTCAEAQPYGPEGAFLEVCVVEDGSDYTCNCTPKFVAENASTACVVTNEWGKCPGVRACSDLGPIPLCDASEPSPEQCNGLDDDCDGETDEEAQDCTEYYQDNDLDGYGQMDGQCTCEDPGDGWLLQGGDCNELVTAINPGAAEGCNGLDDDCDGETDEEGASGCVDHYVDLDGDGFGSAENPVCLCAGTDGFSEFDTDCNDLDPSMSPGELEICDGLDNNCEDGTDEDGAEDCNVFFLDQDGDGWGVSDKAKCKCGPTGGYMASKPGDCDDLDTSINPAVPELCNGIDDNCACDSSGSGDPICIDEGTVGALCPSVANGVADCVEGTCDLVECDPGWSSPDGDTLNGCECSDGADGAFDFTEDIIEGQSCQDAIFLGSVTDGGEEIFVTHNIVPADDMDWFSFIAIDGAEDNSCDTFNLEISFLHNPAEQFVLDVYAGGCAGIENLCSLSTLFTVGTNFLTPEGSSWLGECPCTEDGVGQPGVQYCTDQTQTYWVGVARKAGVPESCAAYTLHIANGF